MVFILSLMFRRQARSVLIGCVLGVSITYILMTGMPNQWLPCQDNPLRDTGQSVSAIIRGVDDSEARRLKKEVRVLIWVLTYPHNHQKKAKSVRDTWGQRANTLLFFSSETDPDIPTIGLNVSEGRGHLTAKSQMAWRYIYKHHFHDADWFMKADDNTYVIVENLRYFLSNEDHNEAVHFGHLFRPLVNQGFYSGGSGYVISKEAFRRYGEKGEEIKKMCRQDGAAEDAAMGKCMERLGARVADSTDSMGRTRFHCFNVQAHIMGSFPPWYLSYDSLGPTWGVNNMSDYTIAFHYIGAPAQMWAMHFLIYHLSPYGIVRHPQHLNRPNSIWNSTARAAERLIRLERFRKYKNRTAAHS